eukprot:sb/3469010/
MLLVLLLATFQILSAATLPGETIVEPDSVDLTADAATIRKAVKGWGTDEKAIINVLANRRYNTRLMLSNVYEWRLQECLERSSHDGGAVSCGGDAICHAGMGYKRGYANQLSMDPTTVRGVKSYYYSLYSEKLRDRIVSETDGTLKTFLLGVLDRGVMNETTVSDSQQAADLTEMKGLMEGQNIDGIATFLTSISLKRIDALQRTYFMETADELVTVLAEMTDHQTISPSNPYFAKPGDSR